MYALKHFLEFVKRLFCILCLNDSWHETVVIGVVLIVVIVEVTYIEHAFLP